jgi:hypothetical protein
MGFLNTKEITVEAILTNKGREKLANGQPLGITKFALSDDEVDYSLYNSSHPNGSEFAGAVIQNTPSLEAPPDETQSMRYKLISLPISTTRLPVVTVPSSSIVLEAGGNFSAEITPNTKNGSNQELGFTAVLQDNTIATLSVAQGGAVSTQTGTIPNFLSQGDEQRTQTVVGRKFTITADTILPTQVRRTSVTIIGNQTGGTTTVDVTVVGEDASLEDQQ